MHISTMKFKGLEEGPQDLVTQRLHGTFQCLKLHSQTKKYFSRMPTGHLHTIMNMLGHVRKGVGPCTMRSKSDKLEHVWGSPCTVRSKINKFEHVREAGARTHPCEQADIHTRLKTLLFLKHFSHI